MFKNSIGALLHLLRRAGVWHELATLHTPCVQGRAYAACYGCELAMMCQCIHMAVGGIVCIAQQYKEALEGCIGCMQLLCCSGWEGAFAMQDSVFIGSVWPTYTLMVMRWTTNLQMPYKVLAAVLLDTCLCEWLGGKSLV